MKLIITTDSEEEKCTIHLNGNGWDLEGDGEIELDVKHGESLTVSVEDVESEDEESE